MFLLPIFVGCLVSVVMPNCKVPACGANVPDGYKYCTIRTKFLMRDLTGVQMEDVTKLE